MVQVCFEELWSAPAGQPYLIVVTTNSVSDGSGRLVMGAGSAGQARDLYPQLPKMCYRKIKEAYPDFRLNGRAENYGFLEIIAPPHGIGIFQTKHHFQAVAQMDAIRYSVEKLAEYAVAHPGVNIRLPFPGIGCGRSGAGQAPGEEEIRQALVGLPDHVTVMRWK